MENIDKTCVNAIRVLAADAVQKANSGHPGLPLGSAAMAYELWARHMKHNAKNPKWANRDRFILSGGHGSTLLYSLLHLFGWTDLGGYEAVQAGWFSHSRTSRIWTYCRSRGNHGTSRSRYGYGCRHGYGRGSFGFHIQPSGFPNRQSLHLCSWR